MKKAIVVPGQGILTKEYLIQQNIYEYVLNELKLILGNDYKLDFNSNIVSALTLAIASRKSCKSNQISVFTGYSVGFIISLFHAEWISWENLVIFLKKRSELMNENLIPEFGMIGVIGADYDELSQLCDHNPDVEISCINSIGNYSLSGKINEINEVVDSLTKIKKKEHLKTEGPWHSSFLNKSKDKYVELVNSATFNKNSNIIVSNTNGKILSDTESLKKDLIIHYSSRISWVDTIKTLKSLGIEQCLETSYSNMLRSFTIFIDRKIKYKKCVEYQDL
jgi:[acyl-carrier-protein] S-malonyltransferase